MSTGDFSPTGPSCELTERAVAVIEQVAKVRLGPLILTISNGCCDGTAPYLYDKALPPSHAACVLETDQVSVYITSLLKGRAAVPVHYVIDAFPDAASDSLSLESDFGWRLTVRMESR
ncbi:DUF779 domain-containing protein [Alicyclobacillus sp. ALC3]|uniref:DUF779 domain-containing protein n=1 Tax=Alicyclobacillus sp. ALC3 TaxID=2796143 RepID=UPI00237814D6|nr:DUF779 domain-containing protein [Alicyclobacillus sp. ALC3]WDL98641.1 DUF779 domain-containing protein [Alicyclobacillus sp. ALC3]